ncbi:vacuolar protein 14 C-terminal Fig4p binding-domain-containing protein, partial [Kickxella alabastrina]|uniref:vacuolar protein 14 C-terminal Fig4p binding-domain-containing protein n=1 Tax=Kickxella alabastrina TaxID=61397 RepID=UPI00221F9CE3
MPDRPSVIPAALAKALADKLYDKQRVATQKIERLVLDALDQDDEQKIYALIAELSTDYATSEKEASRIGGLVALAATAVALTHINIRPFLPHMVPPMVSALSDGESKVRYFACESLYNVAKVSRGHILRWFNDIFDGLARVTADSVKTVKDGADYLDRLIKDIVAEQAATCVDWYEDGSLSSTSNAAQRKGGARLAFSLDKFMPLLAERMHTYKPSTRLYLIEWVRVLDSVPGLDLIVHLPEFLDGLLRFLSDPSDDVRSRTQSLLGELLSEIRECVELQGAAADSSQAGDGDGADDGDDDDGSLRWGEQPLSRARELRMAARRKKIRAERAGGALVAGAAVVIEFARCVGILIPHLESNDQEIQGMALGWILQFTWLCPRVIVQFVPRLVNAVLPSVSHPMAAHRRTAEDVNLQLYELTVSVIDEPFNYDEAATAVMELFAKNVHEPTKVAGMQWLLLLHRKAPWRILTPEDMSFPVLLKMLSDSSEQVVKLDLELTTYNVDPHSMPYLSRFLGSLLQMFATDRVLLETRAALMVRQLCVVLDPQLVFCLFARLLSHIDLEFISVMVQHLSWILVTAPETEKLRLILRRYSDNQHSHGLFVALFRTWSHNPAACLTLCLLSQHYEIGAELINAFGQLAQDLTVSFLVQLDKLVQLIESPVFTFLRLQLLDPAQHPMLVRSLYGLLMMLPQSSAFAILRNRLSTVAML